ncbi:Meiotically up-regulated gene 137 protein [Smittium mucronatum]|uniref:Meiotically up-regulated gene 137 protein n=1 Tax=Smittium mucronatum TaxID=133383 RepID=A0A1R0GTQ0_9FUNG|nr:Meiotically up-regulated gene 137 protein [Smittium mucronatum]
MASSIRKNFGKLGQWTGDILGKEEKSELPDHFKSLMAETEIKKVGTENLNNSLILFTNHLSKKKETTENSKNKVYILEILANSLMSLGESLPRDSLYGRALKNVASVELSIVSNQSSFVTLIKDEFQTNLERQIDSLKEFTKLQKKFENRRLDYESKNNKLVRLKKESTSVEDDCRQALAKYEDSYDEIVSRMLNFQDAEEDHLHCLYSFYQAQMDYHRSALNSLESLNNFFIDSFKTKRPPALERFPNMKIKLSKLDSRRTNEFENSYHMSRNDSAHSVNSVSNNPKSHPNDNPQPIPEQISSKPSIFRRAPPPPPPTIPKTVRSPNKTVRKALYDFRGIEHGELPLHIGDIVQVDSKIDDGWWSGTILRSSDSLSVSRRGMFPVSYTCDFEEPVNTFVKSQSGYDYPPRPGHVPDISNKMNHASSDIHVARVHSNSSSDHPNGGYDKSNAHPNSIDKPNLTKNSRPLSRNATAPNLSEQSTFNSHTAHPPIPNRSRTQGQPSASLVDGTSGNLARPLDNYGLCSVCGCDDYEPNVFKVGSCNNCFHKH